jgi:prepilin-type N-terminal cleavage/methylation domain-containing protein/prepilin-type processing-associated H-X9-DG protein
VPRAKHAFNRKQIPVESRRAAGGFTLVELLVVLAILAILIAILMPVVAGARRQANAVKCATQLREIGHAFHMYAMENRGYYPPSQLVPAAGTIYSLEGVDFPTSSGAGAYWFNFLAKYVTQVSLGEAIAGGPADAAEARRTVFWGCPNWDNERFAPDAEKSHYALGGYGMTYWSHVTLEHPALPSERYPPAKLTNYIVGWHPDLPEQQWQRGRFVKQKEYARHGAQRALVADSQTWALNALPGPADNILPKQMSLPVTGEFDYNGENQTYADLFRHGGYPPVINGQLFSNRGGKVAYNILYCDGHVATTTDWREVYRAVRMRFPG